MLAGLIARRTPRRAGLSAVVLALALLTSGCIYYPGAFEHQTVSPTTRPWWCDSTGDGGSGGGHGEHGTEAYAGVVKGMLSWDDCKAVSLQFDAAVKYAQQYATAGAATSAGFTRIVQYVEGMGTHHTKGGPFSVLLNSSSFDPHDPVFPGTTIDTEFAPTYPEFLMFDGNSSTSKLVGMAWLVKTDNGLPPAGFRGDNDWWHIHPTLCFSKTSGQVLAQDITDSQCASVNGVNVHLENFWMLHAWIVPGWEHHPDVFVNHHPCLLSSGPAANDHTCWEGATGHAGH
ncbi:MAG TPA: hypothetical protein VFZ83_02645 [Acidimicrobiia bacterium]|nr:hypothetical protein [Acidimicrobiia bacterium]